MASWSAWAHGTCPVTTPCDSELSAQTGVLFAEGMRLPAPRVDKRGLTPPDRYLMARWRGARWRGKTHFFPPSPFRASAWRLARLADVHQFMSTGSAPLACTFAHRERRLRRLRSLVCVQSLDIGFTAAACVVTQKKAVRYTRNKRTAYKPHVIPTKGARERRAAGSKGGGGRGERRRGGEAGKQGGRAGAGGTRKTWKECAYAKTYSARWFPTSADCRKQTRTVRADCVSSQPGARRPARGAAGAAA
jgi:hypothetical protein